MLWWPSKTPIAMESESVCPRFLQPARGLTPSPYYTTSQKLTVDPSCLTYILSHMSFERRLVPTIHQINKSNKHTAQKSCDCRRTFGSPKDRISPIYTSITTIFTHWPRLPENGIARKGLCASRGRGYRQAGGDVHGTQPLRSVPGWVGH